MIGPAARAGHHRRARGRGRARRGGRRPAGGAPVAAVHAVRARRAGVDAARSRAPTTTRSAVSMSRSPARAEALYRTLDDDARVSVRRMFERLVVVSPRRRADPPPGTMRRDLVTPDRHRDRWTSSRRGCRRACSPSTGIPTPGSRRWRSRTRRCCASGRGSEAGSTRTARRSSRSAISARRPRAGSSSTAIRARCIAARVSSTSSTSSTTASRSLPPLEHEFLDASRAARDARTARRGRTGAAAGTRQPATPIPRRRDRGRIGRHDGPRLRRGRPARPCQYATSRRGRSRARFGIGREPGGRSRARGAARTRSRGAHAAGDGSAVHEAEEALHRAVAASRVVLRVPDVGGWVDWSPDGNSFVTEGPEDSGIIDIRDARTGESLRSFRGHDVDVNLVAYNHDGTMLATAGDDSRLRVWDPASGDELFSYEAPGDPVLRSRPVVQSGWQAGRGRILRWGDPRDRPRHGRGRRNQHAAVRAVLDRVQPGRHPPRRRLARTRRLPPSSTRAPARKCSASKDTRGR